MGTLDANWARWLKQYGADEKKLCRDGIVAESGEDYFAEDGRRVLFVLKEPRYDARMEAEADERDFRKAFRKKPWSDLVIWTAGILDGFADYEEREREFKLDPTKYLRNIAVVHLKKTFGGAESDMNVINAYAFRDRELLREQISLLRPNYIVACGQARSTYSVTNILIWLLGLEGLQNVDDPLGAPIYSEKGRFRVVPSMHPGYNRRVNRNRRVAYYKELCLMMGKIKDRLRLRYEERIEIKAGGA